MDEESIKKKRKLQLDAIQCEKRMTSAEGAVPLTNPQIPKLGLNQLNQVDPNRGLYPRKKKKRKKGGGEHSNSSDDETTSMQNKFSMIDQLPNYENPAQPCRIIKVKPSTTSVLNLKTPHFNSSGGFQKASTLSYRMASTSSGSVCDSSSGVSVTLNETTVPGRCSPIKNHSKSVAAINLVGNSPNKRGLNKMLLSPQKNTLLQYYSKSPKKEKEANLGNIIGEKDATNCSGKESKINLENKLRGHFKSSSSSPEIIEEDSLATEISKTHLKKQTTFNLDDFSSEDEEEEDEAAGSFGLFGLDGGGGGRVDKNCKDLKIMHFNGFEVLQEEIIEMIFCNLPLQDLLRNATRVCQRWNTIITNQNFLPWKKIYHKLKCSDNPLALGLKLIPDLIGKTETIDVSMFAIITIVNNLKAKPSSDLLEILKKLRLFKAADIFLRKMNSYRKDKKEFNVWCIIAGMILLSEKLSDIVSIFKSLINCKSNCPLYDLIECLYCVASVLLYIDRKYAVGKGVLYRLFYAIYLNENSFQTTVKDLTVFKDKNTERGQQTLLKYSRGKMRLTHEQMRIVNHRLQQNQVIKIIAFAGTGKSTTLVEYTKLRPGQRFLLIVFNKSVCDYAKKMFPGNVECRTAHSLAYTVFGKKFRQKMTFKLRPKTLERFLFKGPTSISLKQKYAKKVLTTTENFINSSDPFLTLAHVPERFDYLTDENDIDKERLNILFDAENIWNKMIDESDFDVRMIHDGYLKLYQLSKPLYQEYSCVLVDEAQDCNPAMLDIVLSQSCPKILVGDPNQQIYSFRGAVNALQSVNSTNIYYLTQSFRFGPEIAYVANIFLNVMKGVHKKTLVGGTQKGSISGQRLGQLAILSRTNTGLFQKAVAMICQGIIKEGEPRNIRGTILGGTQRLNQLLDIFYLLEKDRGKKNLPEIKDKFIVKFSSFKELSFYALNSEDQELIGNISLVEQYHSNIPEYVDKIKDVCRHNLQTANVVFSTVHRAKGLEFDTVSTTDDFNLQDFLLNTISLNDSRLQEEINLLYVAITRAKKSLIISKNVQKLLSKGQEDFEYPVLWEDYFSEEGGGGDKEYLSRIDLKCCLEYCENKCNFENPFVLVKRKIIQVDNDGSSDEAGPICQICSINVLPRTVPLLENYHWHSGASQMTQHSFTSAIFE